MVRNQCKCDEDDEKNSNVHIPRNPKTYRTRAKVEGSNIKNKKQDQNQRNKDEVELTPTQ